MSHDPSIQYLTLDQPNIKDYKAPLYTIFSGCFLSPFTFFSTLFSNTLSSCVALMRQTKFHTNIF